jgi:hypothetical protein
LAADFWIGSDAVIGCQFMNRAATQFLAADF